MTSWHWQGCGAPGRAIRTLSRSHRRPSRHLRAQEQRERESKARRGVSDIGWATTRKRPERSRGDWAPCTLILTVVIVSAVAPAVSAAVAAAVRAVAAAAVCTRTRHRRRERKGVLRVCGRAETHSSHRIRRIRRSGRSRARSCRRRCRGGSSSPSRRSSRRLSRGKGKGERVRNKREGRAWSRDVQ